MVAVDAGADWIGLVFASRSPRHVDDARARAVAAAVAGRADLIGVFVAPRPADCHAAASRYGLAAVQVGVPERVIVVDVSDDSDQPQAFINPEILAKQGTEVMQEGCLSVPGLRGWVERPAHIRYRGLGIEGERIARVARGFHARVVQHECDHLDGRLYTSRMTDLSRLIFESEIRHFQQAG